MGQGASVGSEGQGDTVPGVAVSEMAVYRTWDVLWGLV